MCCMVHMLARISSNFGVPRQREGRRPWPGFLEASLLLSWARRMWPWSCGPLRSRAACHFHPGSAHLPRPTPSCSTVLLSHAFERCGVLCCPLYSSSRTTIRGQWRKERTSLVGFDALSPLRRTFQSSCCARRGAGAQGP